MPAPGQEPSSHVNPQRVKMNCGSSQTHLGALASKSHPSIPPACPGPQAGCALSFWVSRGLFIATMGRHLAHAFLDLARPLACSTCCFSLPL